ncbi:MAG TPA: lamin tail domain-containing protein [Pyrinomonadaceae bacterium]|nr:lamin tail domain-containing protein [Pyrinomonadaceae bacterium]
MLRILIASLFFVVFLFPTLPRSETGIVLNAASLGHEPAEETQLAPGSIASFRGSALASRSFTVTGTTVKVNDQAATVLFASSKEIIFVVPDDVAIGPAEIVVTDSEGTAFETQTMISAAAPGIFTVNGDGRGDAIILDADRLTTGPFDPRSGSVRLSIFATGVRHAKQISVTINGPPVKVDAIVPASLAGLDQIHVLLPAELNGAGPSTLIVEADGVRSNPVSVAIGGSAPADKVVISQIFGGGGNSGAPYRNDFIEIFNAGNTPVNLAGWSIQYASATASTWSTTPLNPVTLSPGQYYLIQQAGGNNGAQLPTPDAAGTIAMAAGSGKVALVKSTTALTGACPTDSNIVDVVGYGGNASCFNGSGPAPPASNTNAATRKTNGCTDTRNNSSDFAPATPNARNTIAPLNSCTIAKFVLPSFADALAGRCNHDFAPTLRL